MVAAFSCLQAVNASPVTKATATYNNFLIYFVYFSVFQIRPSSSMLIVSRPVSTVMR